VTLDEVRAFLATIPLKGKKTLMMCPVEYLKLPEIIPTFCNVAGFRHDFDKNPLLLKNAVIA
jgi:hypothetical protein